MKRLLMLMILDGYGVNDKLEGNAVKIAKTPNIDEIMNKYPHALLEASEEAVGLPKGQMGNSEVGHTNIGAGRVVYQSLNRINNEIEDNSFYSNEELIEAINHAKKNNSNLHIMGLLSDGGVHSHINHLYALLELCKKNDFGRVYIHAFLDGRDTSPTSGINYINDLENKCKELNIGNIITICGRYYAMDRDNRWDRVYKFYETLVNGKTNNVDIIRLIETSYKEGITDEFIVPTVVSEKYVRLSDNDSVIFFNFRPDRAREITRVIIEDNFDKFERKKMENLFYVCFTEYDKDIKNVKIAFKNIKLTNTFGEYISKLGYNQLRIAETEKYAHVTFFFNGGREKPYENESRILINSPKVSTYDEKPEMSAFEVTDKVIEAIDSDKFDIIILNYANPDMVGHTGNLEATIKALECLDICVKKVVDKVIHKDGKVILTADHGNAEEMIDYETGLPNTAHTTNLVPVVLINGNNISIKNGKLSDLAPTMLDIMNENKPSEMTGESLIIKN